MQCFWLPVEFLGHSHVNKIFTEILQVLCMVHHVLGSGAARPEPFYRPSHPGNPLVVWAGASGANYLRLAAKAGELLDEYHVRYGRERVRRGEVLLAWLRGHPPGALAESAGPEHLTIPPAIFGGTPHLTFPSWEAFEEAYLEFYCTHKTALALDMGRCPAMPEGAKRTPHPRALAVHAARLAAA